MEKFYLGMDIGTNSVGMACTDENYNLLRAKGADLWSVRLFDEAKTAQKRRLKRTARRRLQRRRQRINFLQGLFASKIEDKEFFIRLNNSGFDEEDKRDSKGEVLGTKYSLFADSNFTDADFYKEYPTIFHLRNALMQQSDKPRDLRLYYLALHHVIKYRGHFLSEGLSMSEVRDVKVLFDSYNQYVTELEKDLLCFDKDKAEDFIKNIVMAKKGVNDKKKLAFAHFDATDPVFKEILTLLVGGSAKPKILFGEEYKDEKSFSFKDLSDEVFDGMLDTYGDENFELLYRLRAIFTCVTFEKILNANDNISSAMVGLYEKHKQDLRLLKSLLKPNADLYAKMFKSTNETANYVNYVGYTKKGKKKVKVKKCKVDEFYKFVKKQIENVDDKIKAQILSDIEDKLFLPKILNADNGIFPHQINLMELQKIVANLQKEHPSFASIDDSGLSDAQKIETIFRFKIPYYVGPLNSNSPHAWIKRSAQKITPWNFDEVVDRKASANEFILRMTNKCSYIFGEDVLCKTSIIYQRFEVLSQINKLTFNAQPITVEQKQAIFNELYLTDPKKITLKKIALFAKAKGWWNENIDGELIIGGTNKEFSDELTASMKSYHTLKKILGDYVDTNLDVCENIILWHTINTDKRMVEELILDNYGSDPIIKKNIKALKGITSFKEFGRLSKKLLCSVAGGVDYTTGQVYTILGEMYNTNKNFNELWFDDKYTFKQTVDEENGQQASKVTYEDVKELYVSPQVRRGIWQSLLMIDEYVSLIGKNPDKIFIEVPRGGGKKGEQKESRLRKLQNLLKSVTKKDCADIDDLMEQLNQKTEANLRQERLFLYFMQLGKSAYSGKPIDLGLLSSDMYDVDHILPRSFTKDDSIDNKVLVLRGENADKTDVYPVPEKYRQVGLWNLLKAKGLMSEKKYSLLTRVSPLTDDDYNDFINRQLVVTGQTAKAVAQLLERKFADCGTKIVYSKAKNVDDFKQKFEIVKCRETNDLHHARDAYLNVVVGNVYDTKFTSVRSYFYKISDKQKEINLKYLFANNIVGAWNKESSIQTVRKVISKSSMKVTRYSFTNNGEFYNETVYSAKDKVSVPRKESFPYVNTDKYGGFDSLQTAYFSVVLSKDKKGNEIKTIEAIPVLINYKAQGNSEVVLDYLKKQGLIDPQILVDKLKIKTLVSINGFKAYLAGVSDVRILIHNANQWYTTQKEDEYVNGLIKLTEALDGGSLSEKEKLQSEYVVKTNRNGEVKLAITKERNLELYTHICNTLTKKVYENSSSLQSFRTKLESLQQSFIDLPYYNQAVVLLQIIRVLKCNAEIADLGLLVEKGKNCGKLRISKDITDKEFAIIYQSPCGTKERIQKV